MAYRDFKDLVFPEADGLILALSSALLKSVALFRRGIALGHDSYEVRAGQ
jgi:hypothetical protein